MNLRLKSTTAVVCALGMLSTPAFADMDAAKAFLQLAAPQGTGIFGVSRLPSTPVVPEPPDGVTFELRKEAGEVLDSPSWLLRMRHL